MLGMSHICKRYLWLTRNSPAGDCCWWMGSKTHGYCPVPPPISLPFFLPLGLTDLTDEEVQQMGKAGFPFAPRVLFGPPIKRRIFDRKECTWTDPTKKSTTAATNCWALWSVKFCDKHLLSLSPYNSLIQRALISWPQGLGLPLHNSSHKTTESSHIPSTTHTSTFDTRTLRDFENHREAKRETQNVDM